MVFMRKINHLLPLLSITTPTHLAGNKEACLSPTQPSSNLFYPFSSYQCEFPSNNSPYCFFDNPLTILNKHLWISATSLLPSKVNSDKLWCKKCQSERSKCLNKGLLSPFYPFLEVNYAKRTRGRALETVDSILESLTRLNKNSL